MDGRAFYENVKSFCQSRGGPYVNVQQHHHYHHYYHNQHNHHLHDRRNRRRHPVNCGAAASSTATSIAQGRFTQATGQPTVWRLGQTLQRA